MRNSKTYKHIALLNSLKLDQLNMGNSGDLMKKANSCFRNGEYQDAISCVEWVIKIDPNCFEAYLLKCKCLNKQGRYSTAIQLLNNKYLGWSSDFHNTIGYSYMMLGKYKESMEHFEVSLNSNSADFEVYLNIGWIHQMKDNYYEAIENFNKAIKLNCFSYEAYNLLGISLEALNDYDGALKNYKAALNLNKNYSVALNNQKRIENLKKIKTSWTYESRMMSIKKPIIQNPDCKTLTIDDPLKKYEIPYNSIDMSYKKKIDSEIPLNAVSLCKYKNEFVLIQPIKSINEVLALSKLNCKYISKFIGYSVNKNSEIIVLTQHFEHILKDVILSNLIVDLNVKLQLIRQVVIAVLYLQKQSSGVFRCVVTSSNILVTKNLSHSCLIAISALIKDEEMNETIPYWIQGLPYTAPELKNRKESSASSDIYSLGVLLWETVCKANLADNRIADCLCNNNVCEISKYFPERLNEDLKSLIIESMSEDPAKRPSIEKFISLLPI